MISTVSRQPAGLKPRQLSGLQAHAQQQPGLQHAQHCWQPATGLRPSWPSCIQYSGAIIIIMMLPDDRVSNHAHYKQFFCGYKGGKIYWLAIHSNQANLIDGGLANSLQY
jgi:hypothetical protein